MLSEELTVLWDKDLDFSIVQVDTKFAILDNDTVGGIEDIANTLTLSEACIGNVLVDLTIHLIGESNKEVASGESIECVIYPLLSKRLVYNTMRLASLVDCLGELIHIAVLVEVAPENLTILRVISP